jgi:tRNA-(ms[2]io[6]A)-hydroxylase
VAIVIAPVLDFLRVRTPQCWVTSAVADLDPLLLDHATLELKAAQQAQNLIWKYGTLAPSQTVASLAPVRLELTQKMSRLAREELRHFEQVVGLLAQRGQQYRGISPSRYAAGLHALVRADEPGRLVDYLLVGAIIEARSCERFAALVPALESAEPRLAKFYLSLLKSEARHFEDYLKLARRVDSAQVDGRLAVLLERDAELMESPDSELRFHSGAPLARRGH